MRDDSASRPTVLTFVGCYLPGYKGGGPIRTVANLVERLGGAYAFRIVTSDRDHGDSRRYACVRLNEWLPLGGAAVYYASRRSQTLYRVAGLMRRVPHDVLYLNSLFSPRFTLLPLLARRLGLVPARPTVLAPRGELGEGALALKPLKKRAFLWAAALAGLYNDVLWQASTTHEAQRVVEVMGVHRDHVFVAPNLPARPLGRSGIGRVSGEQRPTIVFLSRIARMKNLDFALRVLARVSTPVDFLVYGVIEDPVYWAECQELMISVPNHVSISYKGELPHDRVHEALVHADLFFLPTRGENYGHAVLEALGAGVPVLISDRTPWGDVHDAGVGWALPLDDIDSFAAAIEEYVSETPRARDARSERAYAYAVAVALDDDATRANRRMFEYALVSGGQ